MREEDFYTGLRSVALPELLSAEYVVRRAVRRREEARIVKICVLLAGVAMGSFWLHDSRSLITKGENSVATIDAAEELQSLCDYLDGTALDDDVDQYSYLSNY